MITERLERQLILDLIRGVRDQRILDVGCGDGEVKLHGIRQDSPPKMIAIDYELIVDTDETERRLELLHTNVRKFGTISNTVAEATKLEGSIRRRSGS